MSEDKGFDQEYEMEFPDMLEDSPADWDSTIADGLEEEEDFGYLLEDEVKAAPEELVERLPEELGGPEDVDLEEVADSALKKDLGTTPSHEKMTRPKNITLNAGNTGAKFALRMSEVKPHIRRRLGKGVRFP